MYLANVRLPTEKAHGIQIAKMCEAFANAGADVELIAPKRLNHLKADVFDYYGVQKNFTMKKLFCLDTISLFPVLKAAGYWIESLTFALAAAWYLRRDQPPLPPTAVGVAPPILGGGSVVYVRELPELFFLSRKKEIIYEAHHLPKRANWLFWQLLKKVKKFVVITTGLKDDLIKLGIREDMIMVAPDGVDIDQFDTNTSIIEARERLHLPLEKQIALYTGHLYPWKGSDTILHAAALLPDVQFVTVGGTADDHAEFVNMIEREQIHNILALPHRPPRDIPLYLKAADVLLLPNSAKEKISARYTSPLKLFEYMAAGRPMVASDLPSLREVLDDSMATFFTPDDPKSLVDGIQSALNNYEQAEKRALAAYDRVRPYAWHNRANRILAFVNHEL